MHVRAQVVNPQLLSPWLFLCWLAVEEQDVRFHAKHNQIRILISKLLWHATGVAFGPNDFAADVKIAGAKQLEPYLLVFGAREWPTVL